MIGGLTFKEDAHQYFDGDREIPSVTTILKNAGLINYGAEGSELQNEDYMMRGKVAHKCCELYEKGTLDLSTVDESILPYLEAYKSFKSDTVYKAKGTELILYHQERRFAGTLDSIGTMGGKQVLIEIKTGSYQPWHKLQVAAYRSCLAGEHETVKDFVLELKNNATYALHKIPYDTTEEIIFYSLVNLYYWRKNNNFLRNK